MIPTPCASSHAGRLHMHRLHCGVLLVPIYICICVCHVNPWFSLWVNPTDPCVDLDTLIFLSKLNASASNSN